MTPLLTIAALAGAVWWSTLGPLVPGTDCRESDRACLEARVAAHEARKLSTWRAAMARPLAQRIGPAPPAIVDYLNLDNRVQGFPERPVAATLDAAFLADVQGAIDDLPPAIWALFADRLVGLYFVENMGGTGYTDSVLDEQGQAVAGVIVLDASVLRRHTANGWATWKENTPFKPDAQWRLRARIEADGQDTRRNAIQYILLHELAHVLSIGGDIHPPWNEEVPKALPAGRYPFFRLSWTVDSAAGRYASVYDADFAQRRQVAYYFGAKLEAQDMVPVYERLSRTNFPTLYAATHPGDDFAESFASYVHVVLMKRPWEITLEREGAQALVVRTCWGQPRCAAKERLLEQLLAAPVRPAP